MGLSIDAHGIDAPIDDTHRSIGVDRNRKRIDRNRKRIDRSIDRCSIETGRRDVRLGHTHTRVRGRRVDGRCASTDGRRARATARRRVRRRRGRHARGRWGRGAARATRTGVVSARGAGVDGLEGRERGVETGAEATSPLKIDAERSCVVVDGRPSRCRVGRGPVVTSVVPSSRARGGGEDAAAATTMKISIPPSTRAFVALRGDETTFVYVIHRPHTEETDCSRARRSASLRRRRLDSSSTRGCDATSATSRRPVLSSTAWRPARSSARNTSDTSHRMRISCFTSIARTRAR